MILHRLAQSMREQDWLSITIEFVIVVAGIFVGLQVTEWNERRRLHDRELNYLVRLQEDVESMRSEVAEILAADGGRRDTTLRAFRALEGCDAGLARPDDIRATFAGYQNQRTATLVERTYDEMVSSGALASMNDRELSGEIAGLFGALRNYKAFVANVRISLPVVDVVLWQNLDLSYDAAGRPVLREFDFDEACSNRELRNATWEIHDLMWDWESITLLVASQLDHLAAELDRHLAGRGVGDRP